MATLVEDLPYLGILECEEWQQWFRISLTLRYLSKRMATLVEDLPYLGILECEEWQHWLRISLTLGYLSVKNVSRLCAKLSSFWHSGLIIDTPYGQICCNLLFTFSVPTALI
jgi:hypothetical protein